MDSVSPVNFISGGNKNWAIANKNNGCNALICGAVGTTIGCAKAFTEDNSFLEKGLSFLQAVFLGIRSNQQYSIYIRDDDDLGLDSATRHHAANIGEIACHIETKANPFLLPLTALLNRNLEKAYHSIAHLPNALWWRIRLYSKKINWVGLKDLGEEMKTFFKGDAMEKDISARKIESIITPVLGLIGFCFTGLFTPIKAFNKLLGKENAMIDGLASIGQMTQHIIYFFKFTMPEFFKGNKILFALGTAANLTNIASPINDVIQSNNNFLSTFQKLYKEIAPGLTMAFFSTRRHVLGKKWLKESQD